jgi:hypothetical protein
MKKTHFTNQTVYWGIIAIIGGLLFINLYTTFIKAQLIGLLPITVQSVLLGLTITKHQYAKQGIKIWAIIFLVIASGLQFVGRLLNDLFDGLSNTDAQHFLTTGITAFVGVLIVIYVNKTVEIVEIEK